MGKISCDDFIAKDQKPFVSVTVELIATKCKPSIWSLSQQLGFGPHTGQQSKSYVQSASPYFNHLANSQDWAKH